MSEPYNFQRIGALSNTHAGNDFESSVQIFFLDSEGIDLRPKLAVPVGVSDKKKFHNFDLGSEEPQIIVECKSHTWTGTGNTPSAKMTVWNEAMYYFHVAPNSYRKVFVALRHLRRDLSLVAYYLRTYSHLVPPEVEIWEYDPELLVAKRAQ